MDFLFQIFCDNKIQQILQKDNRSCGSWATCTLLYLYMKNAN